MDKRVNKSLLFVILSFCMLAFGLQVGGFQMVLLSVAREYGLSNAQMGSLVTFQFIAIMIAPSVFGRISDRKGRKSVLAVFSLVFILGCGIIVSISNPIGFVIGISIIGCGASVGWGTISAALADAYQENASKYINLSFCFYSLGAVISPQINNFFMNNVGTTWRICFISAGAAVAVGTLLVLFTNFCPLPVSAQASGESDGKRELGFIKSLVFIGLFFSMLCYCFMENGIGFFANVYFTEAIGDPSLTAAAISSYWFMMIPARLLLGMLNKYRRLLLSGSFAGMAILLVAIFLTKNGVFAIFCIAAIGFIGGPVFSTLIGLGAEAFPQNAGAVAGAIIAGQGIGGALSPFIMGLISDYTEVRTAYAVLALICVLGFVAFSTYLKKTNAPGTRINPV